MFALDLCPVTATVYPQQNPRREHRSQFARILLRADYLCCLKGCLENRGLDFPAYPQLALFLWTFEIYEACEETTLGYLRRVGRIQRRVSTRDQI